MASSFPSSHSKRDVPMVYFDPCDEVAPSGRRPRWKEIQLEMEGWIEDGRFEPGARLPTEEELAQEFSVHRHTVRRALAELRLKDLVRAEQGRGIFVTEANISYRIGRQTRLSHTARMQGRSLQYRLVSVDPVNAIRYGAPLGLPKGHPLIRIVMMRVLDGREIGIMRSYYPLPRFEGIPQWIASTGSVGMAMAHYGVDQINRKKLQIKAVAPNVHETKLMKFDRSMPMLELTHLATDAQHVPIEFSISRYDGRYFDIIMDF